jgi:hypothetical protein
VPRVGEGYSEAYLKVAAAASFAHRDRPRSRMVWRNLWSRIMLIEAVQHPIDSGRVPCNCQEWSTPWSPPPQVEGDRLHLLMDSIVNVSSSLLQAAVLPISILL